MKTPRMVYIRFTWFIIGLVAGTVLWINADGLGWDAWLLAFAGTLSIVFGSWLLSHDSPIISTLPVVVRKSRHFNRWIVDADKPWWYRCRTRTWNEAIQEANHRALVRQGALTR